LPSIALTISFVVIGSSASFGTSADVAGAFFGVVGHGEAPLWLGILVREALKFSVILVNDAVAAALGVEGDLHAFGHGLM
jgi:hypothetical protein